MQGDGVDLEDLVRGQRRRVVIFSWNTQPDLVERAIATGRRRLPVEGAGAGGDRRRARGDPRRARRGAHGPWTRRPGERRVAGARAGLTAREAEVLALITQGLSNQEIAERSYLSINSVKTYIRTAYRKIGVTRRSQAVCGGCSTASSPTAGAAPAGRPARASR